MTRHHLIPTMLVLLALFGAAIAAAATSPPAAWTTGGLQVGCQYGESVASAGDVNGDGFKDVIVGAYLHSGTVASGGAAFVFAGSASGLKTTPVWQAEGAQATCWFGHSVAFMDANGDTWSDVGVGAHLYDVTGSGPVTASNQGIVCMWYGSATGINGGVNVQDVQLMVNLILHTATPGYGLQGDGNVTVSDVQKVVNRILNP